MKKFFIYLSIILIVVNSIFTVEAAQESLLKEQYHHFKDNLQLIKKCYFTKSSQCTQQERSKAFYTTLQIGSVLVVAVAGGGFGINYLRLQQLKSAFLQHHGEGDRELLKVLKPLVPAAIRASVVRTTVAIDLKDDSFAILISVPDKEMWKYAENNNLVKKIIGLEYLQKHFSHLKIKSLEFESFESNTSVTAQ